MENDKPVVLLLIDRSLSTSLAHRIGPFFEAELHWRE